MSNDDTVRQLRHIRNWIAIGAIGFVLIGASFITVAVSWAYIMTELDNYEEFSEEDSDQFVNHALALFESGNLEELEGLIEEREVSHPYDSDVYWYRAKLHAVREEWELALEALDEAELLAPSWQAEYVNPMKSAIAKKRENNY